MRIIQAAILGLFVLEYGQTQDPNCDFKQFVVPGQSYRLDNPNYPDRYPPGAQCRWIGICPDLYNCRLDCSYVDIPKTAGCMMDRLLISRTGDPQLQSPDIYCGRGTIDTVSTGPRISVGLISALSSPGGIFSCILSAQPATTQRRSNCNCGVHRTDRIVNGKDTGVNEYPSMAGLVLQGDDSIYCGGVIIDQRYIMTAAHCVTKYKPEAISVVVGHHSVNIGNSPTTQRVAVSSYVIHPQFNPSNDDYDVAIITLAQDIEYNDRVGPICLPFKYANEDFSGQTVTALGWGTIFTTLQKVDLNVINQDQCSNSVSELTSRQMCTFTPGKDACQHDSGGPLLFTDPSSGRLYSVGIISRDRSCASSSPGISTRVTEILSWIEASTQASYCKI